MLLGARVRHGTDRFYRPRRFAIPGQFIDSENVFSVACRPYVELPSWWSGFLFHVLNPRQLSLYVYLTMLLGDVGVCDPTTNQIRKDLGLASLTIVFDAMSVLEESGFILRERRMRRNVYQRPSCEYTVLRLLESGKIDGLLRPVPGFVNEMSDDSRRLKDEWLRGVLGDRYQSYTEAEPEAKRQILIDVLRSARC